METTKIIKIALAVVMLGAGGFLIARSFQTPAYADPKDPEWEYLCVNGDCGHGFARTLSEVQEEAKTDPDNFAPRCPECQSAKVVKAYKCPECGAHLQRGAHGAKPKQCTECKALLSTSDPDAECADPVPLENDPHAGESPFD